MPQPYRGKEHPVFGHEALLERPHLAAHIGAISTLWESVEESWGFILAEMLHTEAQVGMELYLSLTGSGAQSSALMAACDFAVKDPALKQGFADLRKDAKPRATERNAVVHGRWGAIPSRDDVLILTESNWLPRVIAEIYSTAGKQGAYKARDLPLKTYGKRDFEAIIERLQAFLKRQHEFQKALEAHRRKDVLQLSDLTPPSGPARHRGLFGGRRNIPPAPEK